MIPRDQLLQRITYKRAAEENTMGLEGTELSAFSRQEEWLGCVCWGGGWRGMGGREWGEVHGELDPTSRGVEPSRVHSGGSAAHRHRKV